MKGKVETELEVASALHSWSLCVPRYMYPSLKIMVLGPSFFPGQYESGTYAQHLPARIFSSGPGWYMSLGESRSVLKLRSTDHGSSRPFYKTILIIIQTHYLPFLLCWICTDKAKAVAPNHINSQCISCHTPAVLKKFHAYLRLSLLK